MSTPEKLFSSIKINTIIRKMYVDVSETYLTLLLLNIMFDKNKQGNEGIRKSDSKEGNKKNPNDGYSDRTRKDTIDFPENEIINKEEDLSSGSTEKEPVENSDERNREN